MFLFNLLIVYYCLFILLYYIFTHFSTIVPVAVKLPVLLAFHVPAAFKNTFLTDAATFKEIPVPIPAVAAVRAETAAPPAAAVLIVCPVNLSSKVAVPLNTDTAPVAITEPSPVSVATAVSAHVREIDERELTN